MIHVSPVEAYWVSINGLAALVTLWALVDSIADRRAVAALDGPATELAAAGNVRREAFRLLAQLILLGIAVPALFSDREIALITPAGPNWGLLLLLALPWPIVVNTVGDSLDRKKLKAIVREELEAISGVGAVASAEQRILRAISENTAVSKHAADRADAAYEEANHSNEKLSDQNKLIGEVHERITAVEEHGKDVEDTRRDRRAGDRKADPQ